MTSYVVGFRCDRWGKVLLIEKKRPDWQAGKLNGVGGHIEKGESPLDAMMREFEEETGMKTNSKDWKETVILSGNGYRVHFFLSVGDLTDCKTMTDEEVVFIDIFSLPLKNVIPNLKWLIPLSLDPDLSFPIEIEDKTLPGEGQSKCQN